MRADSLDLELFGRRLRIIVEHPESRKALKSELAEFIADEVAPTGFVMKLPQGTTKFHVLLDQSGFVLGRTRSAAECLGILRRHLEAFAPAQSNVVRFKMRSLIGDDGNAVLAGFPLFTEPAPIERRLNREGFKIVDRLYTDVRITAGAAHLEGPSWRISTEELSCLGHATTLKKPAVVEAVLLPGDSAPTFAQSVSQLASVASRSGSLHERLNAAESLAALPIRVVSPNDRARRYAALVG